MATVLFVHHSPTPTVERLAQAAREGLSLPDLEGVEFVEKPALKATVDDVLSADAYVLGTTVNFGYISGALKHFFDTVYDHVREPTAGRPFTFWMRGGYDTTGVERAMEQITTGLGWKLAAAPVIFTGEVTDAHLDAVREASAVTAASVMGA